MKQFLIMAALALFATTAMAVNNDTSPFQPEVYKRFKTNEANITTLQALPAAQSQSAATDGLMTSRILRVTYDFAVNGGAVSTIALGQTLPAKALVKQVWIYVTTAPTSGGTPGVSLLCEDAGNLLASTDVTAWSANTIQSGASTGTAANMKAAIAAQCNVSITIATAALTAGKFTAYIEYVLQP